MSIAEIGPLLLEWNIAQTFLFLFVLKQNSDATFTAKCVSTVILILKKGYSYAGEMDFRTYCRLIDECAEHNCPSIGMNHANEPLLDKDLIERVNYATKRGIMDIHMNTNAMLLTEEMSKKLLDTGLTRLCFSVDALTPENL